MPSSSSICAATMLPLALILIKRAPSEEEQERVAAATGRSPRRVEGEVAKGPVQGILVLADKQLRELFDVRVYIDTEPDVRLMRRLQRDILERGRTVESVLEQYERTVRPMHYQFVEPSKRYADIIIPEGGKNRVAIDLLVTKVRALLEGAR